MLGRAKFPPKQFHGIFDTNIEIFVNLNNCFCCNETLQDTVIPHDGNLNHTPIMNSLNTPILTPIKIEAHTPEANSYLTYLETLVRLSML